MNNRGYTKIPNAIIRMATISPSERSAWCLIASLPNGYELSVNDACAMLGINQKTWRQCVAVLVKRNMVTVESVPGHANVYSVTPAENWDTTPSKNWYSQKTEGVPKNGTPPLPKNGRGTHSYNKEQLKNIDDDARARVREEVMSDGMVEMGCMSLGIDRGTYENLAFQVFTDWDFQNLPDGEWTKTHFLAVMRYKVSDYKKSNNNGQRTITNGNKRVTGFKILNKA
jgi:hypothetical protein